MGTLAATCARISSSATTRYTVAFCTVALAIGARWALNPLMGTDLPYVTLYPAVAFTAWCCGVGPSVLVIALGIVGARYFFILPAHSLSNPGIPQLAGMLAFALGAAAIIAVGDFV